MKYQIDRDKIENGLVEALKAKVNQLELALEGNPNIDIKVAVKEYQQTSEVARSFLIGTQEYDNFLIEKSKELKQRFRIDIK